MEKRIVKLFVLTLTIFLLSTIEGNTQLNVDSLLRKIQIDYSVNGTKKYLSEEFKCFESKDKLERYDVYFDSTGQLQDYISLAIVHRTFDQFHRPLLIEGFNKSGGRSYWDFPVIQEFTYISDTLVYEMNKIESERCSCPFQSKYRVERIEEKNLESKFNKTRFYIYSEDSLSKLTFAFCSNGKVCHRGEGVYYIYRVFDSKHRSKILEERYYDENLELIDGPHQIYKGEYWSESNSVNYSYSIRELENGDYKKINLYSKEGILVHVREPGIITRPIISPVTVSDDAARLGAIKVEGDLYFGLWRYGSLYKQPENLCQLMEKLSHSNRRDTMDATTMDMLRIYDVLEKEKLLYAPYVQLKLDNDSIVRIYFKMKDYKRINKFKLDDLLKTKEKVRIELKGRSLDEDLIYCKKLISVNREKGQTLQIPRKFAIEDYP